MDLRTEKESEYFVVKLDGDIDASSSIILDKAISEAVDNNENKIIVDCSSLNYISSAGLGVFMSYLEDFKENGISLVLFNVSEKVKNVFKIIGLDELINIVGTKDEAKEKAK